jgi:flagellar basal-body rod protein FlgC
MDLFKAMEVTASGLNAERSRMNTIASNLANAKTTRTAEGGPYKRLDPVFQAVPISTKFEDLVGEKAAQATSSVKVQEIRQDDSPPQMVYDPGHPDADPNGYVAMPNVNVVQEMVNMITASRAYESGVTVMQTVKGMARSALNIGGGG